MHVLRHDYVPVHAESILLSNALQCGFEGVARLWSSEVWSAFVATEGEEVKLASLVEAFQSPRHGARVFPQPE